MTIALFLAVLLFGLAAAMLARTVALPRMRQVRQLEQIAAYGFHDSVVAADPERASEQFAPWLGGIVAPRLGRERVSAIRRQLVSAGFHNMSVETYLGYYALAAVGIPLVFVGLLALGGASGAVAVIEVAVALMMGALVPHAIVARRARLRLEQIDYEMPELVDLLLVGVESGMGLIGAIRVASGRVEGPLGEEIRLTLQQQSLGASTVEALENFADRCDTHAVRSFVRAVSQGERLGVSIGQIMRGLADDMRKHRRTLAEEKANKTPVKILFPLVFMLLPAMFIILLMPAVYQIVQGMKGF